MKDPLINYPFTLIITSPNALELNLNLYSRSFNLQNKETIYDDKKISSILIEITPIYHNLQSKNEVILNHFLNESAAFVTIKYSLSRYEYGENINNSERNPADFQKYHENTNNYNNSSKKADFQKYRENINNNNNSANKEELEENQQLTSELIENFHKTINEINKDMNYQENFLQNPDKNPDFFQESSNKKGENYEESPSKLEKTMVISFIKLSNLI